MSHAPHHALQSKRARSIETQTLTLFATHAQLVAQFRALMRGSKNFAATNRVASGDMRKWAIAPRGGRAQINGRGRPLTREDVAHVYDIQSAGQRAADGKWCAARGNGWRTLNLATLSELRCAGVTYRVG